MSFGLKNIARRTYKGNIIYLNYLTTGNGKIEPSPLSFGWIASADAIELVSLEEGVVKDFLLFCRWR